jgi:hypothetical protein
MWPNVRRTGDNSTCYYPWWVFFRTQVQNRLICTCPRTKKYAQNTHTKLNTNQNLLEHPLTPDIWHTISSKLIKNKQSIKNQQSSVNISACAPLLIMILQRALLYKKALEWDHVAKFSCSAAPFCRVCDTLPFLIVRYCDLFKVGTGGRALSSKSLCYGCNPGQGSRFGALIPYQHDANGIHVCSHIALQIDRYFFSTHEMDFIQHKRAIWLVKLSLCFLLDGWC